MAYHHLDFSGISIASSSTPSVFPTNTHLCHFYRTKADLLEVLVPYFCEGLSRKEFCLWGVTKPLTVKEATEALTKAVPELESYEATGQLTIFDIGALYGAGPFKAQAVRDAWFKKVKESLAIGWKGFRCDGITSGVKQKDWKNFQIYETALTLGFPARATALCSYNAAELTPSQIQEAAESHLACVRRNHSGWVVDDSTDFLPDQKAA